MTLLHIVLLLASVLCASFKQVHSFVESPLLRRESRSKSCLLLPAVVVSKDDFDAPGSAVEFLRSDVNFRRDEEFYNFNNKFLERNLDEISVDTVRELFGSWEEDGETTTSAVDRSGLDYKIVKSALFKIFAQPEDQLHAKQILPLGPKEDREIAVAKARFAEDALSYSGPDLTKPLGYREENIMIITGSSGSGKSILSLRGLPPPGRAARHLTLYVKGTWRAMDDIDAFTIALGQSIQDKLKGEAPAYDGSEKLDMGLTLVLDEAGALRENAGDLQLLQELYGILEKIASYPRLVLSGTGLQVTTANLVSDKQVRKYKMRPWSYKEIEASVRKTLVKPETKHSVLRAIKAEPLYRKIGTNARAAHFLVEVLSERCVFGVYFSDDVNAVIQEVARRYIDNNGLRSLNAALRRKVAKEVYRLLSEASTKAGNAYFPKVFHNMSPPDEKLVGCVYGLIDLNVESRNQTSVLVGDEPFSVSVTESLTIVLLSLVDVIAALGKGWSAFEVTAALHEVQRLVLQTDDTSLEKHGIRLLRSSGPFPAGKARDSFKVPFFHKNAVYVNGSKARFADVIAPFRLCQCKHKAIASDDVELKVDEFVKMGILKVPSQDAERADLAPEIAMRSAYLSVVFVEWEQASKANDRYFSPDALASSKSESLVLEHAGVESRRLFYPEGHLVTEEKLDPVLSISTEYEYNNETTKMTAANNGQQESYDASYPIQGVQAVFYTNGNSFYMKANQTKVFVTETDVDSNGRISQEKKEEIMEAFKLKIREGVDLIFQFARRHN